MSVYPKGQEGLVVCVDYLWKADADRGREEGSKDRPCLILSLTEGGKKTSFLPITHSEPADKNSAVEIPSGVKQRMGLDAMRSWIICREDNVSSYPSMYMRPISRNGPKKYDYGMLPPGLFEAVRQKVEQLRQTGKFESVQRWELKR